MGFWHTGYIEHHEESGLGDNWKPAPTVYRCMHCSLQFGIEDELRKHRFESHPYTRPTMFLRGVELGASRVNVTRKIEPSEIHLGACLSARLNGAPVPIVELSRRLSLVRSDRIAVDLVNAGASASYDIHFQIADAVDLDAIDASFQRFAKRRTLSIVSLDDFITECRLFSSASLYLDGIAQYLYGVLAKERASDSSLPYDKYPERFNAAARALMDFERPLAKLIRGLVALNFNQFIDAATVAPAGRLRSVAQRFVDSVNGSGWKVLAAGTPSANVPEELLTDSETHQILEWATVPSKVLEREMPKIESLVRGDASSYSKLKLKILLVAAYELTNDVGHAIKAARDLLNNPETEVMAERIVHRLTAKEDS